MMFCRDLKNIVFVNLLCIGRRCTVVMVEFKIHILARVFIDISRLFWPPCNGITTVFRDERWSSVTAAAPHQEGQGREPHGAGPEALEGGPRAARFARHATPGLGVEVGMGVAGPRAGRPGGAVGAGGLPCPGRGVGWLGAWRRRSSGPAPGQGDRRGHGDEGQSEGGPAGKSWHGLAGRGRARGRGRGPVGAGLGLGRTGGGQILGRDRSESVRVTWCGRPRAVATDNAAWKSSQTRAAAAIRVLARRWRWDVRSKAGVDECAASCTQCHRGFWVRIDKERWRQRLVMEIPFINRTEELQIKYLKKIHVVEK